MTRLAIILVAIATACSESREAAPEPSAETAQARALELVRQAALCEPGYDRRDPAACQRACDLGHSNSCAQWGAELEAHGRSDEALEQFLLACRGGSGVGCDGAARLESDPSLERDARNYHRVHCEQGYGRSCAGLAEHYDRVGGPLYDPAVARHWRERACRLGFKPACARRPAARAPR